MVSKNTIKLIKSLALKKFRIKENLFLVEGDKNVSEVLVSDFNVEKLFATGKFLSANKSITGNAKQVTEVLQKDIEQASLLKNPQNSIALCTLPVSKEIPLHIDPDIWIYLDNIQDPGNLGTIVRICDWFGIKHLFCSLKTADLFNPKVIQASMGSFCRVEVWQTPFEQIAKLAKNAGLPVFGAFLKVKIFMIKSYPQKLCLF